MSSRTNDEAIYPNSGSMGWFFGFKLHLICNEKGELLNFMITPGDVDDRKPLEYKAFIEFIQGKLVGDKGYISKNLFQRLYVDGIQLLTPIRFKVPSFIPQFIVHNDSFDLAVGRRFIVSRKYVLEKCELLHLCFSPISNSILIEGFVS